MVSKGRHPKKSIADALADVARDGLDVLEVHRGHRWGVLVCTVCGAELALWSSPRVPEDAAKRGAPLRRSPPPRGGGVMHTHEFTFVLASKPTGEELDVLFEIGGGDATPETTGDGTSWLHFDREADSLAAALVSALGTVERAGLQVVAVRSDDLVPLRELAQRTSRSYESVRLLAAGKRGPGAFRLTDEFSSRGPGWKGKPCPPRWKGFPYQHTTAGRNVGNVSRAGPPEGDRGGRRALPSHPMTRCSPRWSGSCGARPQRSGWHWPACWAAATRAEVRLPTRPGVRQRRARR